MRLRLSGARMRGGAVRWAPLEQLCGPRPERWNRKCPGPRALVSGCPGPGPPHHAAGWDEPGLRRAGGRRRLPLQGLQGVADERPLQKPAELLRGAGAHPLPAAPGRQHGGHGSREAPGLRPGGRRQVHRERWALARRAAHATPGLSGPAAGPGLHSFRQSQKPGVRTGTGSEAPTPPQSRDHRSGWARGGGRQESSGNVASGADPAGAAEPVFPARAQRPRGSALPAFPPLPAGRPGWGFCGSPYTLESHTQAVVHDTVTSPILDE